MHEGQSNQYSGVLIFNPKNTTQQRSTPCELTVSASTSYVIRYSFQIPHYTCLSKNECLDNNLLVVSSGHFQDVHVFKNILKDPGRVYESDGSEFKVIVNMTSPVDMVLELNYIAVSYMYGRCVDGEIACGPLCLHRNVACRSASRGCGLVSETCFDDSGEKNEKKEDYVTDKLSVGGITIGLCILTLVPAIVCIGAIRHKFKRDSGTRGRLDEVSSVSSDQPLPDGDILSFQNDGYIFEPPPSYSSIVSSDRENMASCQERKDEQPPCYTDVVRDLDRYCTSDEHRY